jgi:hypothetical protein
MPAPDSIRSAAGRLAFASRRDQDPRARAEARREFLIAKAAYAIREAVACEISLTADQRSDLAALLTGPATYPVHVTIDGVSGLVCRCCGIPLRCQGEDEA